MKTLVTILFAIITVVSFTQNDLCKYKMYSKIWRDSAVLENGHKVFNIFPINSKCFSFNNSYIEQNINECEIEKYLLDAFNEFRKDYNAGPVTQNVELTKGADQYSKKLTKSKFEHDVDLPYGQCECISGIAFIMFSKVTKEVGNINKIIADSYFDIFANSNSHMDILLDKRVTTFGFGVTVVGEYISIVIRGMK